MALPPTAMGAAALVNKARGRLAPKPRRIPSSPTGAGGGAPTGSVTPGTEAVGRAATATAMGEALKKTPAGLKGFRLATGSPTTMSRSDPTQASALRSAVDAAPMPIPEIPRVEMSDEQRAQLESSPFKDMVYRANEAAGTAPDMPIAAPAMPPRMAQGRPVNPDGTITGANGGTQQMGDALRRRLGMEPGGPPAAPPGLKGFRLPPGFDFASISTPARGGEGYGSDAITRPLAPQPVEPPTEAPLPTSFRRRRPDTQIGGVGALGGF